MDATSSETKDLVKFGLLVASFVLWVTLVVILLPRLLGRLFAFLINRTSRNAFHIQIPTLHLYPLSGRVIAHSICYTVPDGTFSIEELVLQIRWWRKAPKATLRHLSLGDVQNLDPLAAETHELDRENAAWFIKRILYRIRRWWKRTALVKDPVTAEPPPLISLIAVGMRVRLVNVQANYQHVNRVLDLAKRVRGDGVKSFEIPIGKKEAGGVDDVVDSSETGSSETDEAKPFVQRVLELVSLRITSGAFYLCDMGESPLLRINLSSAKVRYRYGAPACSLDECRKRFRVRLSGLKVSVADRETVSQIVEPGRRSEKKKQTVSNTDRVIKRIIAMGHRGIVDPHVPSKRLSPRKRPRSRESSFEKDPAFREKERGDNYRYRNKHEAREAKRKQVLPCADILLADIAIIDYVFDEPGPNPALQRGSKSRLEQAIEGSSEGHTEDLLHSPPPVCKVSILLRGTRFSYDTSAIADVERIMERLQPAFYDLMPLAMKVQSLDGKRAPSGIQIDINATPVETSSTLEGLPATDALISIPFNAKSKTWRALTSMGVRRWPDHAKDGDTSLIQSEQTVPPCALRMNAKRISVQTEIPYQIGGQQKTTVNAQEVESFVSGVTNIPFAKAQDITIVRVLHLPQVWNDVHNSTVDIVLRNSETTFLPDTLRVIDDLSTTFRDNAKKPDDVRYFVPFKETMRIRAEDKYKVVMTCGHDNAWEDIASGSTDKYGKVKVSGDSGELVLSQSKPTEFLADAVMSSWTLSLPSAAARLELPLPVVQKRENIDDAAVEASRPSESERSLHHKHRTTSLAHLVRSQLTSHHHQNRTTNLKPETATTSIKILQMGKLCKITGRITVNEDRKYLNSRLPAFVDSADVSDITFTASSAVFDFNPHHTTSFLNLIRNYAGNGNHTITTAEHDHLLCKRKDVVKTILEDQRHPSTKECIILGLPAGQVQAARAHRNAMDELFSLTFNVQTFLIRLHDLPHTLCPFSRSNKSICSVEAKNFCGSLSGNRRGMDLRCGPDTENRSLTLKAGFWELKESRRTVRGSDTIGSVPVSIIENFEIQKRIIASPEWGSYFSELDVVIGSIHGCILDLTTVCLSRIALSAIPHQLFEDQAAVSALLSVDNIDVQLGKVDLLVLSTSSNASAERSGQMSRLSSLRNSTSPNTLNSGGQVPRFLTGVTHFTAPVGLRFCISNNASESHLSKSRLLVPNISVDVLMSWGEKLTPWVDDATLRVQVAHAVLVRGSDPQGSFQDGGLLRRAAEMHGITVEVLTETRPYLWSSSIAELQQHHLSRQRNKGTRGALEWLTREVFTVFSSLESAQELDLDWSMFLERGRRAMILTKQREQYLGRGGKAESLSTRITASGSLLVSPESLELVNDIIQRSKEDVCAVGGGKFGSRHLDQVDEAGITPKRVFSSDIREMWYIFEAARPPAWSSNSKITTHASFRGLETSSLRILLLSPLLVGERRRHNDLGLQASNIDDTVEVSFPHGIHALENSCTDGPQTTISSFKVSDEGQDDVLHSRVFHISIPQISIEGNSSRFCLLRDLTLIYRERSRFTRAKGHQEKPCEVFRDDRNALVFRLGSISLGRKYSALQVYAGFGRVVSIFMLMTRALALENASVLSAKNSRIEKVCKSMSSVSMAEFVTMRPEHVHSFFAEASNQCALSERTQGGVLGGVAFSDVVPKFSKVEASILDEKVERSKTTSLDICLKSLSLRLSNEEIFVSNNLFCKGGSTEKVRTSSALEGLVLKVSVGNISLSIRDDIAANTLRMVSDVASFVRRATFSMPMLRYETDRESKATISSPDVRKYSFAGEDFVGTNMTASLEKVQKSREQDLGEVFPSSRGFHRSSRAHWYRKRSTRIRAPRIGTRNLPSSEPSSWNTRLFHRESREAPHFVIQRSRDDTHFGDAEKNVLEESPAAPQPKLGGNTNGTIDTSQGLITENGRRRNRPQSSNNFERVFKEGIVNNGEVLDDGNQIYTYSAVPTAAVETGPPRKRAKCMVPTSAAVPPAFSDSHRVATRGKGNTDTAATVRARRKQNASPGTVAFGRDGFPEVESPKSTSQNGPFQSIDKLPVPNLSEPAMVKKRLALTLFVSCGEIMCRYFRRNSFPILKGGERIPDLRLAIAEPRLTFMSAPAKGSHSLVVTAASGGLRSANDDSCILSGSIEKIGVKLSIAQSIVPYALPKIIASARVSGFRTTLHATDMKSVLKFRENFKLDLKAVLSAFMTTKSSISEMLRATRLSSSKALHQVRSLFSTMAFDLLFENSQVALEGFHPRDNKMRMAYLLDGLFFSIVASEDDNAALTLGLRLYGHGLSLSSPSWPSDENFHFPSLDARGVQWGESTGLPTLLKVSAEPLLNCTSMQGLRNVLFTVAGLMEFQNMKEATSGLEPMLPPAVGGEEGKEMYTDGKGMSQAAGATPFSRSFAAWERTKGVRMDLSIRPMSISLVSGMVVTLFQLEAITGIVEWNKLVVSGVQLQTAISIPKILLTFMRMPSADFSVEDIQPNERRSSMSISLEKSRIDVLKTQEDLTHTFVFRIDIFSVSGQLRPWRFVTDAAVWADEQELVSDLHSITHVTSATPKPRTPRTPRSSEMANPLAHRIILFGTNVQRFKLAVPLLNSEEYATSRLALRATELHFLARKKFDNLMRTTQRNILEVKSHFIGILWENSALFSSHHARITLGMENPRRDSSALFGALNIVMVPGTWRICPRKDVVLAILEAKNGGDSKAVNDKTRDILGSIPDVLSRSGASVGDSLSNTSEKRGTLLVERLRFKMLRTSGAIEGLDDAASKGSSSRLKVSANRSSQSSQLTLPAFSVAMARDENEDFDVIDVDFSGREGGEFPPKCIKKVSNILTDLFGVVASDKHDHPEWTPENTPQNREVSRDVSVLIRYGQSMYKAQEDLGSPVESKFSFFAGRSSTILVSLSTEPVFGEEDSHTTVIAGISPKLALEITPHIEGAMAQSLRLIDVRFLHGVNPCCPPQSLFHVSKVTALMDAKTLLVTQGRLKVHRNSENETARGPFDAKSSSYTGRNSSERNAMVFLGQVPDQLRGSPSRKTDSSNSASEPDIRLQLKLPLNESETNQVDLAVDRLFTGFSQVRDDPFSHEIPLNVYFALHEVNLRALWDILSCRLRMQENLFSLYTCGLEAGEQRSTKVTNILNRLNFESRQHESHTMKLAVDALATIFSVPRRDILVESTSIHSEVSYTMIKSATRMLSQMKRLHGEVKLLLEREMSKEAKRNAIQKFYSRDGRSVDSLLSDQQPQVMFPKETPNTRRRRATAGTSSVTASNRLPRGDELLRRHGKRTRVLIKGEEFSIIMRGYQFEESQHSAMIAHYGYDVRYEYDFSRVPNEIHVRKLGIDFADMKMSYKMSYIDDRRTVHSDLFRVANPKLHLKVVDTEEGLTVELLGDLLLRLGPGFYYWQNFKKLFELTLKGIPSAQDSEAEIPKAAPPDRPEIWNGRTAQVSVRLKPRIDVIGDLTEDMIQFADSRQGSVDIVPKHLYDFVAIPIETVSEKICDVLLGEKPP